ncbi:MAG TPA: preprotein translocase subunit SecA [Acidimicrobiales bacterium]|jgi:preprotein translocase subunit SecA|nr:preprotein translocase subunit SecA [Acidimicrobiales bacterium]
MGIFTKVLRAGEGKKVRALQSLVPDINALEPDIEPLSDEELAHRTVAFRERLANGEDLNDLLVEAFATVREAARRTIGQRHFDVQLMGGAALHFGWIAEMKTGEGKTLVSTLPVYLNGLTGQGVHVVTTNDYLAKRDAEWMGQIHRFLGLSVGRVSPDFDDWDLKKEAYNSDVTYGTNTEMGFDYLRDNMARSLDHMVQRGHVFAIVDEVDSILIDEARTPLIIAGPATDSVRLYYQFAGIARTLVRDRDYEVDEEKRTVAPTEEGIEKVERQLGLDNLYDLVSSNLVHQLTQSLRAKELYRRDKDYIVADGEVKIVDEFTGRVLEGRRWSDGLHQAVEAKERVKIKEENHTWATVTLQNYFRLYKKLAGMTGTAETEASEFANTYNLPVVPIPTNRPLVRMDQPDLIYKTELAKFEAVIDDLVERYDEGQPVLVGTASVEKSEVLSRMLDKRGIPHNVLNAKQHEREAGVVAQAGRLHAITVATNMAGRGVDILLGGNPEGLAASEVRASGLELDSEEGQGRYKELLAKYEESCAAEGEKVRELGGLYVLGSERHESRRIDNQLRGRAGRQGDPGESRFFLSLEDELMRLFATGAMNWVMGKALPDDVPIEAKMVTKAIERAQNTVEARNSEVRKDVLKYDEVMNKQRKVIYERRRQIMDGENLRDRTIEVLSSALETIVRANCPGDYQEDWDLEGLLREVRLYYPTQFTVEDLAEAHSGDEIYESLLGEAIGYYETREQSMPGDPPEETMRSLEREVMLQIIDQKWREHLSEMDYLREGINLRAMGQQDPLVEWQREGFDMFGQMMASIDDDYVKIVMHAQVQVLDQVQPDETAELARAQYLAADDPVQGNTGVQRAIAAGPAPGEEVVLAPDPAAPAAAARQAEADAPMVPIVKDSVYDKVGRNDACPCGSGKKFKFCHGRQ